MKRIMRWFLTKLTSDKRERLYALFKYSPPSYLNDRLTFEKHDEFILISKDCPSWWFVKHIRSGKKGLVPSNHVARLIDRDLFKWCHMDMGRDEATRVLENSKYPNGSFIIRFKGYNSETQLRLTLKCLSNGISEILHYKIIKENNEFGVDCENENEMMFFPTLTKFLIHYARFSDGLKQNLIYSVKTNEKINVWEIDQNAILLETILGEGEFGKVFKGKLEGQSVAVKTLKLGTVMTTFQFMNEAELARNLTHDNIVRTIGVCTAIPYIVTEFIPGCDLKKYVKKNGHVLTQSHNLSIAQKIARAMAYLEDNGIVHRDLAARNVLVGKSHETIKLADFGLARCLDESDYYKTNIVLFPYKWSAPEAFVSPETNEPGRSSSASDVWSFAVVLWEIFSKGMTPYPGFGRQHLHAMLTVDKYRLPCVGCDTIMYSKMLECWSLTPADRPTFAQLNQFLDNLQN